MTEIDDNMVVQEYIKYHKTLTDKNNFINVFDQIIDDKMRDALIDHCFEVDIGVNELCPLILLKFADIITNTDFIKYILQYSTVWDPDYAIKYVDGDGHMIVLNNHQYLNTNKEQLFAPRNWFIETLYRSTNSLISDMIMMAIMPYCKLKFQIQVNIIDLDEIMKHYPRLKDTLIFRLSDFKLFALNRWGEEDEDLQDFDCCLGPRLFDSLYNHLTN